MKGENFFSSLPIVWRLSIFVATIVIAVAWYLYCRRQQKKRAIAEAELKAKETPPVEKKVFKLGDFLQDPLDKHRFISPVDPRLTVREIEHKNHDIMTFATSWPHLFADQQLIEIQKRILETTKISCGGDDTHEVIVNKSAAANFSDFKDRIIEAIFIQLHTRYALNLFWQKAEIIPTAIFFEKPDSDYRTITINFQFPVISNSLLNGLMTINSLTRVSHMTRYPQAVFLHKKDDYSWHDVKQEITSFFKDYFPAGIELVGEWSTMPNPVSPINVNLLFNGNRQLILTFLGINLREDIKKLLIAEFWGIDSVHICHFFEPQKSVVTISFCPEIDFFQPFVTFPPALKKYDDKLDFNLKVIHPARVSNISEAVPVNFQINAFGQLAFFLPFFIDSGAVEKELLEIAGVTKVDFGYEVHTAKETRFVLSKADGANWSELRFDILSALVLSVSPVVLNKEGEWPEDIAKALAEGQDKSPGDFNSGNLDSYAACTM